MNASRIWMAASLALLGAACGGPGSAGAGQTGTVSVLLKDAPGDFSKAVVTISEVDLVGSAGTVVLSTTPTTTDLLTLANDTAKLVDGAVVPPGTYSQLRFVLTGACLEVGGVLYASSPTYAGLPGGAVVGGKLQMPSLAQSGLKVDLPEGTTVGTGSQVLLVDFDVSQSFGHAAGASGMWVMHPVVHATQLELTGEVDATLALAPGATLPGTTTLADFTAQLTSTAGGDVHTLQLTGTAGGSAAAAFKYLAPGTYTLTFTAPAGVTFTVAPAVPASVTVTSGQPTPAAFVVTPAAATAAPPTTTPTAPTAPAAPTPQ